MSLKKVLCVCTLLGVFAVNQAGAEEAYTVTKVETSGNNTYTNYKLKDVEYQGAVVKDVVPEFYRIDLKTYYGDTNGENVKNFSLNNTEILFQYDGAGLNRVDNAEDLAGNNVEGNFIDLHYDKTPIVAGVAISNSGKLGDVIANFVGNSLDVNSVDVFGGVLYNTGSINNINGNFIGNGSYSQLGYIKGGTINNAGTIGNIVANFIGNYSKTDNAMAYGSSIRNVNSNAYIENIEGNFIGNSTEGKAGAFGGAIHNEGGARIGNINANFIANKAISDESRAGAIASYSGEIGSIKGDFIANSSVSLSKNGLGGAIHASGTKIGDIEGNFINNYTSAEKCAYGGAINVLANEIGNITANFVNNYAEGKTDSAIGGALHIACNTKNINGLFYNNKAQAFTLAAGGAIHNEGSCGDINATFIENKANSQASKNQAYGGAIYNTGSIGKITGDFVRNSIFASTYNAGMAKGGAIFNNTGSTIGDINGNFVNNTSTAYFGRSAAIENFGQIGDITGAFIGNTVNSVYDAYGAAIQGSGEFGNITGNFIDNSVKSDIYSAGGAIQISGKIKELSGNFINNSAVATADNAQFAGAGAIRNNGTIEAIVNSSFINNYAKTANSTVKGGAIYTSKDLDLIAREKHTSYISGNYVENKDGKRAEAIFVDKSANLGIQAQTGGSFVIDDIINGDKGYSVAFSGDESGKIFLNNKIINADISLENTNLFLSNDSLLNESSSIALNSGMLSMVNNQIGAISIPEFSLMGVTSIAIDADLARNSIDRIVSSKYNVADDSMLNVSRINLISDSKNPTTQIMFADRELAGNVAYTGENPIAYSPIYKYDVSYTTNPEDGLGYFNFIRGGSSANPSENFNPSVLATPVTSLASGYTTQMQTFNYAFQHSDYFMTIPYLERLAIKESGRYALSPTSDATDVGTFSPLISRIESSGVWVKPYVSFENIPLKNGPKVSNISYGSLIGYDTPLSSAKFGFDKVLTGYVGYNGASQSYTGVSTAQNGGLIGGTATLYKGNFFSATTLSAGASTGNSQTMYGSDNYAMLIAGIGNKTGYNFEFREGRYIIQPSFLINYTFVNTFDYTNAAGVRIKSSPLNAIQLSPGVKFIANTKNGWQPYLGVNMVWNILDTAKVTANEVRLPEMSIKPYVQYGLGLQKRIKERFMAYGQAMVMNGGRNGISLSFGLRYAIGKGD